MIAGYSWRCSNDNDFYGFAVVRYTVGGERDATFGDNGGVCTQLGRDALANAVAVQTDGKIVAAGYACPGTELTGCNFAVIRLTAKGAIDKTFSGDGRLIVNVSTGEDLARSVAMHGTKIVVGGDAGSRFGLIRLTSGGSLDTTFSGDGRVTTTFATGLADAAAMVRQSDGKIIMAGFVTPAGGDSQPALARFVP